MTNRNPTAQIEIGRKGDEAHFSGSPSLAILRKTYGDGFPSSWLLPQIFDLVVYSNSKGTLNEQQMEFLAEAIAQEYYFLTADELLLFFYRFKLGRYGHFYGTVDPMRITMALELFCDERIRALTEREKREEQERKAEHAKTMVDECEFCVDYCRERGYPEMRTMQDIILYEMAEEKVNKPTD